MSADAFASEKAVIHRGEELLAAGDPSCDLRQEYRDLLRSYRKLFKMSRLLMRTSDRSQKQLKEAEEALARANRRMEKELNVGQEIQMAMLPGSFPAFPDIDSFAIFAALVSAREVGGDFYDFYMLDSDRLCFCIGDVSGKGVPSALFMAVTQTLIRSAARAHDSTAEIMVHVNDELSRENDACMFVTIFIGILDLRKGRLLYTNAGHNPPMLCRPDGRVDILDQRHGPAVGAMGGLPYREDMTALNPGDMLLLYTDGVTEAMDPERNLFGAGRIMEIVRTGRFNTPENAAGAVFSGVREFESGAEQTDDITLLALKYLGSTAGRSDSGLLKIRMENRLQEIVRVNRAFNDFAAAHGVSRDTVRKINLVFDELLNNIISYGFNGTGRHDIGIMVHLADGRLIITIAHEGPEFDPESAPKPDINLLLDERRQGGLGLFLVKSLMDEFFYWRIGLRNIQTIVKKLDV